MKCKRHLFVAGLFLAVVASGQAPPQVAVSGKITDSITHQPIPGAQLSIRGAGSTSDETGAYSVYPETHDPEVMVEIYKAAYVRARLVLTLKPGIAETRDFELTPAAGIAGHLVDRDSGKPIVGFYVQAIPWAAAQRGQLGFQSAPSGTDGSFRIAGLAPGVYCLAIDPPMAGRISAGTKSDDEQRDVIDYGPAWFPGVPRVDMAAPLTLVAGENLALDVQLSKRQLRHIGGVIEVPQGMRRENITLSVSAAAARTAADGEITGPGSFCIGGLEEGSYIILASTRSVPGRPRAFARAEVELAGRGIDDVKLTMRTGVALRAVVKMAEDKVDLPARLAFLPISMDGWLPDVGTSVKSDPLLITGLPPGRYTAVLNNLPGYAVASVSYNGQPASFVPIDLEAPESTVTFSLTSRPGSLTGVVRDSDGSAVSGATVFIVPTALLDPANGAEAGIDRRRPMFQMHLQIANSDSIGSFHIADLAPGSYNAVALPHEQGSGSPDLAILRDRLRAARPVVVEAGRPATADILLGR